jgi:hypothetical protein
MVARLSSSYDILFSYFCTELLLYSKNVTSVSIPRVFMCESLYALVANRPEACREGAAPAPRSQTV